MDTSKSGPMSLTSISEDIQISKSKSIFSSCSDYKDITEVSSSASVSVGKIAAEPKVDNVKSDNLAVDCGTDDQMSSGTFSQDGPSPQSADLPSQFHL